MSWLSDLFGDDKNKMKMGNDQAFSDSLTPQFQSGQQPMQQQPNSYSQAVTPEFQHADMGGGQSSGQLGIMDLVRKGLAQRIGQDSGVPQLQEPMPSNMPPNSMMGMMSSGQQGQQGQSIGQNQESPVGYGAITKRRESNQAMDMGTMMNMLMGGLQNGQARDVSGDARNVKGFVGGLVKSYLSGAAGAAGAG